jgi:hypothetical protein
VQKWKEGDEVLIDKGQDEIINQSRGNEGVRALQDD